MIFYVIFVCVLEIVEYLLFSFKYIMIMKLNTYRLSSLEDPTDEQLHALMEQVAVAARESSRKAKRELERRMQEVREKLKHIELKM